MKKHILQIILLLLPILATGQQEFNFSQFTSNKLLFNPGYAGSGDCACFTLTHREQWLGLEGAPSTSAFSFNMPLLHNKIGIGLSAMNDKIGYFNATTFSGIYSYRVLIGEGALSFGLQGSYRRYSADEEEIQTISQDDPLLAEGFDPFSTVNFGGGIYFENKTFFGGVSAPRLMKKGLQASNNGIVNDFSGETPHFYVMGGMILTLSEKIKFRPGVLAKYVKNAPWDFDLNASFGFFDKLWLGATYRFSNAGLKGDNGSVSGLAEFQITPQFKIGAAYDYSLSKLNDFNKGTVEVMLGYCLVKDEKGVRNPRFF